MGYSGTGTFTQSGGSSTLGSLWVGYNSGGSGTYALSGSGSLWAYYGYVGYSGTGAFLQSGGTNTVASSLYLGYYSGVSGTYGLSGNGQLSAANESAGYSGSGTFLQSGGTNSVASSLNLGYHSGSSGTYSLSGNGLLAAAAELVGGSGGGNGLFQQNGGANVVAFLSLNNHGTYSLTGGTVQVTAGLVNQGVFDGGGMPATLSADCLLDLTSGTWQNLGGTTLSLGAQSLLIVPSGFNTSSLGGFSSLGLVHTTGTTLVVPAGQAVVGAGAINDLVELPRHACRLAVERNHSQWRADLLRHRELEPGCGHPDGEQCLFRH